MKSLIRLASGAALFAVSSFLLLPAAHAAELESEQAPQKDKGADARAEDSEASDKPERPFAVELNPLGVFVGHYSIQGEWMPAKHHALVLNPSFNSVTAELTAGNGDLEVKYEEKFTGVAAELGYRFYTGSRGMNGFYVGPSLLVGTYTASAEGTEDKHEVSFTSIGGALDIGGQAVLGSGVVIGGGFGLQYTKVSEDFTDLPLSAAILAGGGVRPRFLLSVGYAF